MPRSAPGPVQPPSANRTDLSGPVTPPGIQPQGQPNGIPQKADVQPVRTPTGMPYGEAGQLTADQQAVPLPQPPGAPSPSMAQGSPLAAALGGAAKQMQMPTNAGLTRPTERPNEPVTAGLPGSPVGAPAPRQVGNLSSMISAVAEAAGSAALSQLASRAASLGQ